MITYIEREREYMYRERERWIDRRIARAAVLASAPRAAPPRPCPPGGSATGLRLPCGHGQQRPCP